MTEMTEQNELTSVVSTHVLETQDFPSEGVLFRDFTPLFCDGGAFRRVVDIIAEAVEAKGGVDLVAGIEARGFLLCAAIGYRLGAGIVPIRKAGKLPAPTVRESYALEYAEATIEVGPHAVTEGDRVLIVDDVLATGGTMVAAATLMRRLGAQVVDSWVLLEIEALGGAKALENAQVPYNTAMTV